MSVTVESLLEGVRASRRQFLKHCDGLTDAQWLWKPYPEVKSVRETLVHLLWVDRAALESLRIGAMSDWEGIGAAVAAEMAPSSPAELLAVLEASHAALLSYITERYGDGPLDATITLWGVAQPAWKAIPYLSSEDYYHAGQVAAVRLATDPEWNYYAAIYGG